MSAKESTKSELLHSCLLLLTTLNNGLEDLLGRASKGVIFNTGTKEGHFIGKKFPRTNSIEKAIASLNQAYEGIWDVELFKEKDQESYYYEDERGLSAVNIVVRNCPIRQAVLSYDLDQAGPICYLTNGYLCGMIGEIMDKKVGMKILHHAPNACLKKLTFREKR